MPLSHSLFMFDCQVHHSVYQRKQTRFVDDRGGSRYSVPSHRRKFVSLNHRSTPVNAAQRPPRTLQYSTHCLIVGKSLRWLHFLFPVLGQIPLPRFHGCLVGLLLFVCFPFCGFSVEDVEMASQLFSDN